MIKKLNNAVLKGTQIIPLIGKSSNSTIQLYNETHKNAGDNVTFSLLMNLFEDRVI
ncbi:phage capsid family protein [Bartonella refiksaydamii]|uniref:phage capsid family protein n=1 Tax=Bartonella refiksaydamii TaxID=2654951 RepID=UPI0027E41D09|nr:DUF4043 family protein [Bartonella refiksaydamii]